VFGALKQVLLCSHPAASLAAGIKLRPGRYPDK
jgi:hypothetical protein